MKNEQSNQEVMRDCMRDYMTKREIKKSELASIVGISPATISNIDNGKWDLISEEMWQKLWSVVQPLSTSWKIVGTANFNTIYSLCENARQFGQMVGLTGYTGAGKSTALRRYHLENPNAYYVVAKKSMNAANFLAKVLQNMGVNFRGSKYDMVERIILELNSKRNQLLIIDEAGKLPYTVLQYIHSIKDDTEGNAGIVLAGVEYFEEGLVKAVSRNKQGMPEFFSRVMTWQKLSLPTRKEIQVICEMNGLTDKVEIKRLQILKDFRDLHNRIMEVKTLVSNS